MAVHSLRRRLGFAVLLASGLVPLPALAAEPWEIKANVQLPDGGRTSQKVELVDIDADSWVDIVFANSKGEGVSGSPANREINQLLLNDQGMGFTELATAFEEDDNAWVIKAGDVDNDGDADLVVGDNFTDATSYVLINEGNKMFTREDIPFSANLSIGELELGDVDRDGFLDIFAADWGPLPHGQIDDPGAPLRLWLGNGDGTFSDATSQINMNMEVLAAWSFDLELVDINNDYALDVMVSTRGDSDPAVVLLNDGQGNFSVHMVPVLQPMNTKNINVSFTPMDFDGDGYMDIISLQDGGVTQCVGDPPVCARRNSVYINAKNEQFTIPLGYWAAQYNPGKNDFDAATLDFNNDGKPDFVVAGTNINGTSRIFVNDGTKFSPPSMPADGMAFPVVAELNDTVSLMFADFDHDRREDVAVAQRDPALANFALFGRDDPVDGVPEDNSPPRIYDDNLGDKLGTLLYFGQDAGLEARVNDYKTPTHWHDFLYDPNLANLKLTGDGAGLTAHKRRLPYMEFALSLVNPDDIKNLPDNDPQKYIAPSIWFGEGLWRVGFTVPFNGMKEDTLTWQYCAIDAANNKTCLGPFSVNLEIDPADCGDGVKQDWEECDDALDQLCVMCANTCGDGMCAAPEDPQDCPEDCPPDETTTSGTTTGEACDGVCQPDDACPNDCIPEPTEGNCGNNVCEGSESQSCPQDCDPTGGEAPMCNDGICSPGEAESCPDDCVGDSATTGTGIDLGETCGCRGGAAEGSLGLVGFLLLPRRRRERRARTGRGSGGRG